MSTVEILTSPIINGTPSGSGIPVIVRKRGSAAGTYSTTSASYVDVDTANLTHAAAVPAGWKATITVSAHGNVSGGGAAELAIFDGATELSSTKTGSSSNVPLYVQEVVTGDGAIHIFRVRFLTSAGTFQVSNGSAANAIRMFIRIEPAA